MIAGLQSRYSMHQNALETNVESYKKDLPEGMQPSLAHVDMILRAPHCSTAKVKLFSSNLDLFVIQRMYVVVLLFVSRVYIPTIFLCRCISVHAVCSYIHT